MPIYTQIGLAQRLRDVDYHLNKTSHMRLTGNMRIRWDSIKKYVTTFLLDEATAKQQYAAMTESRHRDFMVFLQKEIDSELSNARTTQTSEELEALRRGLYSALKLLVEVKAIAGYLALESDADADQNFDPALVEAQLSQAPYNLGVWIETTNRRWVTLKTNDPQCLGNGPEDIPMFKTELGGFRYYLFIAAVDGEILKSSMCSQFASSKDGEGAFRVAAHKRLYVLHRDGLMRAWLEQADKKGPGFDKYFETVSGHVEQYIERVVRSVYRTHFYHTL